eukprot:ANDGO_06807.mRNA.1 Ras-related protein RABF2a
MFSPTHIDQIQGKVVLIGDSGGGKTSIVQRFVTGAFDTAEAATVGATFLTRTMVFGSQRVKLQIWDTAGADKFRAMQPMYYRGANAAVLVVDVTRRESFESARNWVDELLKFAENEDIVMCIACNKIDLVQDRKVSFESVKEYATSINARCFETSAKTNTGVEDVFFEISRSLLAQHGGHRSVPAKSSTKSVNVDSVSSKSSPKEKRCSC